MYTIVTKPVFDTVSSKEKHWIQGIVHCLTNTKHCSKMFQPQPQLLLNMNSKHAKEKTMLIQEEAVCERGGLN